MSNKNLKLDYNNLMRLIVDTLDSDDIETVADNAYGIGVGLELLTAYIKNIAVRAIELNDEVLIGLLFDMCLLTETKEKTEETEQ